MPVQIPLPLNFPIALDASDFWVGEANKEAVLWLKEAIANRTGLFIYGPKACGKSHLLGLIAKETASDMILLDDIFPIPDEERLLHLYNDMGGRVIATARVPPSLWPIRLPDLRSRLLAMPLVAIHQPDSQSLEAILLKLLADKRLKVTPQLVTFICQRIERSYAALVRVVEEIDQLAWQEKREITIPLLKEALAKCAE